MAAQHSENDDMVTELVKDHGEVEELFGQLEQDRAPEERQQIVEQVITELVRHSVAEEQHLYPTARTVLADGDTIADREIAEHAEVEQLLKRLENLTPTEVEFDSTVRQVISDVRAHVEEEEGDLFPRLQHACTAVQLRELGDKIRSAKATAPTHPHPKTPTTPPANRVAAPLTGLVDRVRDTFAR